MLKSLLIQNYILIDELQIDFSPAMNVITGETGAGKSILIGALSLLMGERSSAPTAVDPDKKIVLESEFHIGPELKENLSQILPQLEIDWDEILLIRREFNTSGKSRLFINDTPVKLKDVQALSPFLIELHQQFDHLSVKNADFQMEILDSMALQGDDEKKEYSSIYEAWQQNKKLLAAKKADSQDWENQRDYNAFVYQELVELDLKPGEIESMEERVKLYQNREELTSALSHAYRSLDGDEASVLAALRNSLRELQNQVKNYEQLGALVQRMESSFLELEDLSQEIESLHDSISSEEEGGEDMVQRLDDANRLLNKHKVNGTDELLAVKDDLAKWLDTASNNAEEISTLEKQIAEQEKVLLQKAQQLSDKRKSAAPKLIQDLTELLKKVGMEQAQMDIDFVDRDLYAQGVDEIQFLLDANNSGKMDKLGAVASGGELNRIMLSLKSILADRNELPSLIFDEIDSGISGEPARQVGLMMKELAQKQQVIAITHQASIAALGDRHFYIFKKSDGQGAKLKTNIREIENEDREHHLAELIGGKLGGDSALAAAKKLLSQSS